MKVLHVIPSLAAVHGGPSKALPEMARALAEKGIEIDVATTDDDGPGKRLAEMILEEPLARQGYRVFYFAKQTEFYKSSWCLWRWLRDHAADYQVIHIHAVFSFATLAAALAAWLSSVPYVVRPLGVLNDWGMKNRRRWLKMLSFRLLDKHALDHAAMIHYTSEREAVEAAPLGIKARTLILPLGLNLNSFSLLPSREERAVRWPQTRGHQVILYLSRLDEKKGLPTLLEAFADVHQAIPKSQLMIAGSGTDVFVSVLKKRVEELGLASAVLWVGHLEAEAKAAALAGADVYCLPSQSENFGIALLEALASGLPSVTTSGVALACESTCEHALIRVPPGDAHALSRELQRVLQDETLRQVLSKHALKAAAFYSQSRMADQLIALYRHLRPSHSSSPTYEQ